MKSKIILIRHGITIGNERRLYYGSTDVPLAEKGKEQLQKQKEEGLYPYSDTAEFYTSGMLRTEQTLEIIYGDRPHKKIEELRELNFGDFEMKRYEELNDNPDYQAWIMSGNDDAKPPNGESMKAFGERIRAGFKELVKENRLQMLKFRNEEKEAMTICICHGGVISAIMDSIWPGVEKNFYEWIPDPGHGYTLLVEDCSIEGWELF